MTSTLLVSKFRVGFLVLCIGCSGCAAGLKGKLVAYPDGESVPDATVTASRKLGETENAQPLTTRSAQNGRFSFANLQSGIYNLVVSTEGFVEKEVADVTVLDQKATTLTIELVRKASVSGVVRGPEEQPFSGAEILPEDGRAAAVSGENGEYLLQYLDLGPNLIFAVSGELTSGPLAVELQPGANKLDIKLKAMDLPALSLEGGREKTGSTGGGKPLLEDGSQ